MKNPFQTFVSCENCSSTGLENEKKNPSTKNKLSLSKIFVKRAKRTSKIFPGNEYYNKRAINRVLHTKKFIDACYVPLV